LKLARLPADSIRASAVGGLQAAMQKKLFSELGLSPELLKAVAKMGFEEASPIQSETIPVLLAGRDVVGLSQTGSGKTAAFAIPAIERVDGILRAPQVLILCPTRELAMQVAEEVAKLGLFKRGVRELPIYGGQSYDRQLRGLREGAQIIIGTPGRVMDHLDRKTLNLEEVGMVILDEADRMLDMGFREDIETILKQAPAERQTVFFSATMPPAIRTLIKNYTRDPVNVRIEAQTMTVPAIDQVYYEVDRRSKLEVLCRLIDLQDIKYGIIFCGTKMMCDELADHLKARGYSSDKLHGDISQAMRERVVAKFRKRGFEFLVATDVAARGLDVDDIEVVFNYDLPQDAEDYVHRIGRTGRAGKTGRAITFVAGREIWKMQQIIRFTKGKVRREKVPSAEEVEQKRTNAFIETLRETLEKGEYRRQDALIDQLLDAGYSATDISSALLHLLGGDKPAPQPVPEEQAPRREFRAERDFDQRPPREYPKYEPISRPREEKPPAAPRPAKPLQRRNPETSIVSHEPGMVRLAFNLGNAHRVAPGDFVGVIAGVARLPKEVVGRIDIGEKKTYVDVSDESANFILKKLNGIKFKGHKLAVMVAR
jgi:ATP-dependent RNA helicase DeaD